MYNCLEVRVNGDIIFKNIPSDINQQLMELQDIVGGNIEILYFNDFDKNNMSYTVYCNECGILEQLKQNKYIDPLISDWILSYYINSGGPYGNIAVHFNDSINPNTIKELYDNYLEDDENNYLKESFNKAVFS